MFMARNFGSKGGVMPMFSFRPLVYGYSNARVRAMRKFLLSRRQAEEMLKLHSTAAVIEYLQRTHYKEDFANMPLKISEEGRVELAVTRNFARTAQKLLKITPDQSKETVQAFLSRYDIQNVKTILLAKKLGKTREETLSLLLPAGSLKQSELNQMLNAKNSEELYTAIRSTNFGAKFLSSVSIRKIPKAHIKAALQYGSSDSAKLDMFLTALDFHYYESANPLAIGDKDAQAIAKLIKSEIDAKNIVTVMRLKREKADKKTIMENMLEGGSVYKAQLEKLAGAKDISEIIAAVSDFFISETGADEFNRAEQMYKLDGQLSHFEVVFEKSLARRSLHTLRSSILSIGAIVGFFLLKEEEMNNIKKIVRGKALGIPPEKVAEMLVFAS